MLMKASFQIFELLYK